MQERSHHVIINVVYVKQMLKMFIHTINYCPFKSAHYYLPMRHDMVAKTLYKEIIKKKHPKIEVLTSVSFKKMDTI